MVRSPLKSMGAHISERHRVDARGRDFLVMARARPRRYGLQEVVLYESFHEGDAGECGQIGQKPIDALVLSNEALNCSDFTLQYSSPLTEDVEKDVQPVDVQSVPRNLEYIARRAARGTTNSLLCLLACMSFCLSGAICSIPRPMFTHCSHSFVSVQPEQYLMKTQHAH